MYGINDLQAYRQRTAQSSALALAPSHNRSETQVVPAQSRGIAFAHFGGQKITEGLLAFALGALDAGGGEPQFLTNAADPNAGFGLKALLSFVFNAAQVGMLATGFTFQKKFSQNPGWGSFVDGTLTGAASTSWVTFAYAQGNIYGTARAEAATKGLDGLDYSAEPHMLPVHHSPAAAPSVDPAVAARVQAGRAQSMRDPNAMFF